MLTDANLIKECPHLGGVQRVYRVGDRGISAVNGAMLHSYPFAWEFAVLYFEGEDYELDYSTELTEDVVVFDDETEAAEWLEHALATLRVVEGV